VIVTASPERAAASAGVPEDVPEDVADAPGGAAVEDAFDDPIGSGNPWLCE
jgi:hypothetical protein